MTGLRDALTVMPVIGILRGCPSPHVAAVAAAAVDAGLTTLEITLDSPNPFTAIEELCERSGLVVGAGTVRTVDEARRAVASGARFLVSPHLNADVVAVATEARVAAVPGAASPTEILAALRLGAELVKVFPARQLGGPQYVDAVIGPLGNPPLVPTGGVDASNAAAFLAAGATALGIGSAIFPSEALGDGDAGEVGRRCRSLIEAIT